MIDRYFYSIEYIEPSHEKVVHLIGNIYCNEVDPTNTDHRDCEWCFFYIPINELREMLKEGYFFDFINERVQYMGNITKLEAIESCLTYFNEKSPGKALKFESITEETPCGDYFSEEGEW